MVRASIHPPRSGARAVLFAATAALGSACGGGDPFEAVGRSSSAVTVCAAGETLRGVDVSEYQGAVDWESVAGSGVTFAIARVSDGTETLDPEFSANWSGIKAAGMVRGVYQFFRASEDPVAQANLLVDQVVTIEPGDLSPVADVEVMDGESGATLVVRLAAWVARIRARTGRVPIVYASPGFWDDLPDTEQFSSLGAWVADWGPTCPDTSTPWTNWQFWQYADDGSVPGIGGPVDLDSFNGTLSQLRELGRPIVVRNFDAGRPSEGGPEGSFDVREKDAEEGNPDGGSGDTPSRASTSPSECDCDAAGTRSRGGGAATGLVILLGAAFLRRRRATLLQESRASVRMRWARGRPLRSRSISRPARA